MDKMAMSRKGVRMLLAGLLVMVAGYILLTGGGVTDPEQFNYAMFDFRRLVVAPLVIIAGIVIEILAIMGRFDGKEADESGKKVDTKTIKSKK